MLTSLRPHYYMGIDCGGTHTEAVIANESGYIIGRGQSQGANIHNASFDITHEAIIQASQAARNDVKEKHPEVQIRYFDALCIGLAGFDTAGDQRVFQERSKELTDGPRNKFRTIIVVNDGLIGLRSGTEKTWGICLSASTGSSCYAVGPDGNEAKAGGWGYFLGDQGSGFSIGKALLKQVIKEFDGRAYRSRITDKVLEKLGLATPAEIIPWIYSQDRLPVAQIASLCELCNDTALIDSIEVGEIINRAVHELIIAYEAVIRQISFSPQLELPVVLVGSLFQMRGPFSDQIIRAILNRSPQANIVFPTRRPAEGAIRIAQESSFLPTFTRSNILMINPIDKE